MKMSGMLTRSSMACSLRPSRCRSKASPRMACRRRCGQGQGLWARRVPLPSPEACGSNNSFIQWPLGPARPEHPGRRALTSQTGRLKPSDLPGEGGHCRI